MERPTREQYKELLHRAEHVTLEGMVSQDELEKLRTMCGRVGLDDSFLRVTAVEYADLPDDHPRKGLTFPEFVEERTLDLMSGY